MSNGTTSGIRVVTDSSCDLPTDLANEFAIKIVPLTIRFGTEEFVDREELDNATFWDRLVRSEVLPETAAPSSGAFAECFQSLVDDGATGVVCINLSSHLSATMQSAQVAARSLDGLVPIAVIDSLSASMGVGNLCLDAARLASEGADVPRIVEDLTGRVKRTRLVASLATLEYLRKGGRIGTAKAMLGSMLSIKPTIEVVDGRVTEAGKVRTRSKAIQALAERVKAGPVRAPLRAARGSTGPCRACRSSQPAIPRGGHRGERNRACHRNPYRPRRARRHLAGSAALTNNER